MQSRALFIVVGLLVAVVPGADSSAQCADEMFKLLASDGTSDDSAGFAVALHGTTALIGAPGDNVFGTNSGSAYLFDTSTGLQLVKLTPTDGQSQSQFGYSVAVSGSTAVVGSVLSDDMGNASGSAYLFDTSTGSQTMKLLASDGEFGDRFGFSVAIDGTMVLVGATYDDGDETDSGSAYLFDTATGTELRKLEPNVEDNHDYFGTAVALSGGLAVVGAPGDDTLAYQSGAAYLLDAATGLQLFKLLPSDGAHRDGFGSSVAISGTIVAVGSPQLFSGTTGPGAVYLFDTTTGEELSKLQPDSGEPFDVFGNSVAIAGNTVIVGSIFDDDLGDGSGSAYVFDAATGVQTAKLLAGDGAIYDQFGVVGISGTTAVIGSFRDDDLGTDSGSAYVFDLSPLGSGYCVATPNSTGLPATMSACGGASLASNDLMLLAQPVPSEFYLFYYGDAQIQAPFGNGFRCAGGATRRLNPPALAVGGLAARTLDLPAAGILSPGVLHFQCWYRDSAAGGAGFDLSNGWSISFVP